MRDLVALHLAELRSVLDDQETDEPERPEFVKQVVRRPLGRVAITAGGRDILRNVFHRYSIVAFFGLFTFQDVVQNHRYLLTAACRARYA